MERLYKHTFHGRDANLCWYASSVMESKIDLSILEICMAISYFTFIIMVMAKARDVKSWHNIIIKMK